VNARGRSEAGFELELRRDLAMQALPNAIQDSSWVPAPVLDRLLRALGEKREVREARFDPARLAGSVSLGEEQLKAFYDQNAGLYRQSETVSVQYVVLDGETLAATAEIKPEDVASFYQQNQRRYATSEERSAAHILLRLDPKASDAERAAARARAQELLDQVGGGADFAELARTRSEDPGSATQGGDLGFFTRDLMVKPFADASFEMKVGETRGPIETEFGLHLIRLTGIREARVRPVEEVRAEIEAELRRTLAARKFAESAEAFTNTAYEQPDSLDPVAARFSLPLRVHSELPRGGAPDLGRDHPLNHPKVLSALFSEESIRDRRNIEAVEQGGRIVSARVTAHQAARQRPFDEVREEVIAAATRAEALKLAREQGQKLLSSLRAQPAAAGSGQSAAAASDASFSEAQVLSRVEQSSMPQAAVEAIFKASSTGLPALIGVDLGDAGYGVYQFTRVIEADEEALKRLRESTREAIERATAEQELRDYLESRKAQAEVVRSLSRIAPPQR
jgi:peptidyl-prolyl cis-trans isomerase D